MRRWGAPRRAGPGSGGHRVRQEAPGLTRSEVGRCSVREWILFAPCLRYWGRPKSYEGQNLRTSWGHPGDGVALPSQHKWVQEAGLEADLPWSWKAAEELAGVALGCVTEAPGEGGMGSRVNPAGPAGGGLCLGLRREARLKWDVGSPTPCGCHGEEAGAMGRPGGCPEAGPGSWSQCGSPGGAGSPKEGRGVEQ